MGFEVSLKRVVLVSGKLRVSEKGLKIGLEFSFGGTRDFEKRDVDFM